MSQITLLFSGIPDAVTLHLVTPFTKEDYPCMEDDILFDLSRCRPTWSDSVDFSFTIVKVTFISAFVGFLASDKGHCLMRLKPYWKNFPQNSGITKPIFKRRFCFISSNFLLHKSKKFIKQKMFTWQRFINKIAFSAVF